MRDLERDLRITDAIASDLKAYLLSNDVYWSLSERGWKGSPFPKGTLGGLLLRLHLLDGLATHLSPEQWERFSRAQEAATEQINKWRVQAEQKAQREAAARLRTWETFVEEASDDPARHRTEYPSQVEGRVILDFLLNFAGRGLPDNLLAALATADKRLGAITSEGDFVWDDALRPLFPTEQYPWLYVQMRQVKPREPW